MNHGHQRLDWELLVEELVQFCRSSLGQEKIKRDRFAQSREESQHRFDVLLAWEASKEQGLEPPFQSLKDVYEVFCLVEEKVLTQSDLLIVEGFLTLLHDAEQWISNHGAQYPKLAGIMEPIDLDSQLYFTIQNSFDPQGEFQRSMYPRYHDLIAQRGQLHRKVQSMLKNMLVEYAPMLQENFYTQRNGRYVFPMRATYKRSVGIVHGRSQSGETFYVEPLPLVAMVNRYTEAIEAIEAEKKRILHMLSAAVRGSLPSLMASLDVFGELDVIQARSLLGKKWQGVVPTIGEEGILRVEGLRHPIWLYREKR